MPKWLWAGCLSVTALACSLRGLNKTALAALATACALALARRDSAARALVGGAVQKRYPKQYVARPGGFQGVSFCFFWISIVCVGFYGVYDLGLRIESLKAFKRSGFG